MDECYLLSVRTVRLTEQNYVVIIYSLSLSWKLSHDSDKAIIEEAIIEEIIYFGLPF